MAVLITLTSYNGLAGEVGKDSRRASPVAGVVGEQWSERGVLQNPREDRPTGISGAVGTGGDLGFVPNNHVVPWETVDARCLYLKAEPSVAAGISLIADLIAGRFAENRAEYYPDQGVLAPVHHAARRRLLSINGLFVSAGSVSVEGKQRELSRHSD